MGQEVGRGIFGSKGEIKDFASVSITKASRRISRFYSLLSRKKKEEEEMQEL